MKKNEKKLGFYSDTQKYPTELLYDMLRRPVYFNDYSWRRKVSAVITYILVTLFTLLITWFLFLYMTSTDTSKIPYIALVISTMSLAVSVVSSDSNTLSNYTKEEIKAEIEYRKYKVTELKCKHRKILENQMQR